MSWHGPHVGTLFHPSEGHAAAAAAEALMEAWEVGEDLLQAHLLGWWSWPIIIAPGARVPCGTLTGSWHRKEQEVEDTYHGTSLEVPCCLRRCPWPLLHGGAKSGEWPE